MTINTNFTNMNNNSTNNQEEILVNPKPSTLDMARSAFNKVAKYAVQNPDMIAVGLIAFLMGDMADTLNDIESIIETANI